MTKKDPKNIYSTIWEEESEPDNPFAAKTCRCHGFDVYDDILEKASWFEYIFLLFTGKRATKEETFLLERLALAIANLGPREASIRAAMNGGVGGSTAAGSLIAALGIGAGNLGGAQEIYHGISFWQKLGLNLENWRVGQNNPVKSSAKDVWPPFEHIPGFDPHGESCPTPIRQTLGSLCTLASGPTLPWIQEHRLALEEVVGYPLSFTGVAIACFLDLKLTPQIAEMLYLILRLPGAAVHTLEQQKQGWRNFPFFGNEIVVTDDPGPMGLPTIKEVDL